MPIERPSGVRNLSALVGVYSGLAAIGCAVRFLIPDPDASIGGVLLILPMILLGLSSSIGMWRMESWSRYAFVLFVCAWYIPALLTLFGGRPLGDFWLIVVGLGIAFGTFRAFRYLERSTRSAV